MLKGMKTISMLVLVLIMSISGANSVFGDEKNSSRQNKKNDNNGRRDDQRRGGRDKVLALVKQSEAGKTEIARHRKAMEGLKEEGRKMREQIKSDVQEKVRSARENGEEINRDEVREQFQQQARAHASKMFNEAITHRQNLLNIAKSMEDEIIDKYMQQRRDKRSNRGQGQDQGRDHKQNPGHKRPSKNEGSSVK